MLVGNFLSLMQSSTCIVFFKDIINWLTLFSRAKRKRTPKKNTKLVHKEPKDKADPDVSDPEPSMASEGDKMKLGEVSLWFCN